MRAPTSLIALLAALACAATFAAESAVAANETEEDLIKRGVALRRASDDQAARDVFQKAYDRFKTPRAAGQLGLAEQALGRWEDAELHVAEALRAENDPWSRKNRAALVSAMAIIKNHVARIEITGEPEGAAVFVNGRPAGQLPLRGPVNVSVGEVDVEARAPGYKRDVRRITLVGGQYQRLVVRLEKESVASPSTPPPEVRTAPPERSEEGAGGGATNAGMPPVTQPGAAADTSGVSGRSIARWSALGLAVARPGDWRGRHRDPVEQSRRLPERQRRRLFLGFIAQRPDRFFFTRSVLGSGRIPPPSSRRRRRRPHPR